MKIKSEIREYITIEVPAEERMSALEYAWKNGYTIKCSGPKQVAFATVDMDTFVVEAYRTRQ